MKLQKIWYVACTIFCVYHLKMLVNESYEVESRVENRSEPEPIILACNELSSFHLNETVYEVSALRNDLYHLFNTSNDYRRRRTGLDKYVFKRLILDPIEKGSYRIFNDLLCITVKDFVNDGFHLARILSPMFLSFKNCTTEFFRMQRWNEKFDQLVVLRKGHRYSNCRTDNSKFGCLNSCYKRSFRLARYFYESNETGPIHLNLSTNQTIKESEKNCQKECQRENCKMVQLISIPSFEGNRKSKTTTLKDHPKLDEFDFWVQFIGLVCSFVNVSLNQIVSMAIRFTSLKVKRSKVRIGLLCLKFSVLFLSLAYCSYLYTRMAFNYKAEEANSIRKEVKRNSIKQKAIHLVICIDVRKYLTSNRYDNDLNKLNKTMFEITKETERALDDHLEGIHLNYQGRSFRINYIHEPKVLFRAIYGGLKRCFSLIIRPDYQLMPFSPKLLIKFKIWFGRELYVLTENESFSEETYKHDPRFAFKKIIVKRLKSSGKCVDYREKYSNCTSRLHCIAGCVNRRTVERFGNLTVDFVIDRDQVKAADWNGAYLMEFSYFHPNRSAYKSILRECSEEIPDEQPCEQIRFKKTFDIVQQSLKVQEIDLSLDVDLSVEELSLFNLLINLLNIQSIFFGMNVLRLLRMIFSYLKPKLRIRSDKTVLFLIYLLCSLGFTWHTYRIFDLSINGQLTYNQVYEIAERVQMPVLVFCHPIEENLIDENLIDKNHKLTGNYLEQMTSEITAESVFESITYLNESNEWIPFNLSLVERFYIMHLKCFRIKIDQQYDRNRFRFSFYLQVLKVNFTKQLYKEEEEDEYGRKKIKKRTVYFMTKTRETTTAAEFNNIGELHYELSSSKNRYSAEQSELVVNVIDNFRFIKQYLSTSNEENFGDQGRPLPDLKSNEYSQYNFGTLKTPLEKDDFGLEIRDDLFDQLSRVHNVTTYSLLHSAERKTFVTNHLGTSYSGPDFTFSLGLIKRTLWVRNEARLVLVLLNVLFWFDLSILDVYPIFHYFRDYLLIWLPTSLFDQITRFLLFCYRLLKKLKLSFYKCFHSLISKRRQRRV